jgi:glycosyltransferase involved in cell wall biosynthesis
MDGVKNILIVISSLKLWGWAEKIATTLGTALQKTKKHNIHYFTFYDAKQKYLFEGQEFCLKEKLSWNPLINVVKLFSRAYQINKYCRKHQINTSLSFMEEANFSNIISKKLFWNKSKILVSIRQSVDMVSKLYQQLIKWLYPGADLIIPNSEEEKENLIHNYCSPRKKTLAIHNFLDLKNIDKKSEENTDEFKISEDLFTFITIWRLDKQKNQSFIIEAFKLFYDKYSKSQLLILWEGEKRAELETQISKHPNIFLLGNQDNVYKFLKQSDCFLFASLWEGFPNAVIEAMACGLPIVSTTFKTGIRELLNNWEYWILLENFSVQSFFESMKKIYQDQEIRKNLSKKSLQRTKNFDVRDIIKEREKIL